MKTNNMPIMPTVKLTPDIGSVAKVHDRTTLFDNEMSGIHNDIFSPKNLQLSAPQTNQPRIYPLLTIYKITDYNSSITRFRQSNIVNSKTAEKLNDKLPFFVSDIQWSRKNCTKFNAPSFYNCLQ